MAIIKKGITYNGTPVTTLTYDGTQVKEVWYGTDKLVYFYGEGTPGLRYIEEGSALEVIGYGELMSKFVKIPEKTYEWLDGNVVYAVKGIGRAASSSNTELQTIDIQSCSYIYPNAFKGCDNLTSVHFPLKSGSTYYTWSVLNPDTGLSLVIDPNSSGFDGAKLLTDTYAGWKWTRNNY